MLGFVVLIPHEDSSLRVDLGPVRRGVIKVLLPQSVAPVDRLATVVLHSILFAFAIVLVVMAEQSIIVMG